MQLRTQPLEKLLWSEADFPRMGWHDASIHAMAALPETFELAFDLDYIVEWVQPVPPNPYFKFWVAPATLIFTNVADVQYQIASPLGEFTLQDIQRRDPQPTPNGALLHWLWVLAGNEGSVQLRATGYQQVFRRTPLLVPRQALTSAERGGISFSRQPDESVSGPALGR